nr:phenylalanine--tRNA ligase subunit beta [Deltaproteobacteria bacterium]
MLVSYTWLKELVPITISPEELAHRLTMAGLEVAGITRIGDDLENVVVAQIEELSPHPNADRLSLCQVNDGTKMLSIVCGASNMKAGDKVALAPIGTKLPNGVKIKASKIRGINSEGMLCSEEELNLEKESTGIMILPPEARIGALVATELGLKDFVLDVDLTPNRADCLSMVGIAREVGALLDLPVSLPSANLQVDEQGDPVKQHIRVVVDAPDLCPRYAARYVSGVTIKPSPLWLRQRLERAGIRAINNVVDITNYILLTWGQPMHAFDYSLLDQGMIRVRRAAAHDRFFTLDEKERLLDDQTLMICDASKYVAIGGIMGGLNTEIAESTQTVLLESAYFTPHGIRRTSRFLGLQTESSARFEKGVDPEAVIPALNHAAQL